MGQVTKKYVNFSLLFEIAILDLQTMKQSVNIFCNLLTLVLTYTLHKKSCLFFSATVVFSFFKWFEFILHGPLRNCHGMFSLLVSPSEPGEVVMQPPHSSIPLICYPSVVYKPPLR